jgi:hypothetical protein
LSAPLFQSNQHDQLIATASYLRMAFGMLYTPSNRWELSRGVRAMRCAVLRDKITGEAARVFHGDRADAVALKAVQEG